MGGGGRAGGAVRAPGEALRPALLTASSLCPPHSLPAPGQAHAGRLRSSHSSQYEVMRRRCFGVVWAARGAGLSSSGVCVCVCAAVHVCVCVCACPGQVCTEGVFADGVRAREGDVCACSNRRGDRAPLWVTQMGWCPSPTPWGAAHGRRAQQTPHWASAAGPGQIFAFSLTVQHRVTLTSPALRCQRQRAGGCGQVGPGAPQCCQHSPRSAGCVGQHPPR